MTKVALLALIPMALASIQAQAQESYGDQVGVKVLSPAPWLGEPLRFVLNEPAYVAAFIIYPGSGVRMIYPDYGGQEQPFSAGYHSTTLNNIGFDDDIYNVTLGPTSAGPYYLYVIASRNPLGLDRFVHRPMLLANSIGNKAARSFYVDVEFDALVNNAIALGDDSSWGADSYMIWPGYVRPGVGAYSYASLYSRNVSGYQLICSDGHAEYVPANYPFASCPAFRPRLVYTRPVQRVANNAGAPSGIQAPTVLPTLIGRARTGGPHLMPEVANRRSPNASEGANSVAAVRAWGEHRGIDHTMPVQAIGARSENHGFWHREVPATAWWDAMAGSSGRRANAFRNGEGGAPYAGPQGQNQNGAANRPVGTWHHPQIIDGSLGRASSEARNGQAAESRPSTTSAPSARPRAR